MIHTELNHEPYLLLRSVGVGGLIGELLLVSSDVSSLVIGNNLPALLGVPLALAVADHSGPALVAHGPGLGGAEEVPVAPLVAGLGRRQDRGQVSGDERGRIGGVDVGGVQEAGGWFMGRR